MEVKNTFSEEKFGSLVNWSELDALIGRLLTHIEAMVLDPVAREANKSIVKNLVREWMRDNDNHYVWGTLKAKVTSYGNGEYKYEVVQDRNCTPPRS